MALSKKQKQIIAGTAGAAVLAGAILLGSKSCNKKYEPLVVPSDRAMEVYGANAIYRYELICDNPNNDEFWLKTLYQDGTTKTKQALLDVEKLSHADIDSIKRNLTKYQTVWIDPDFVDRGPSPDGFNRPGKYPVTIEKNDTGTIVHINDSDALNFIDEYEYSVKGKKRGKGNITPDGIKEPQ